MLYKCHTNGVSILIKAITAPFQVLLELLADTPFDESVITFCHPNVFCDASLKLSMSRVTVPTVWSMQCQWLAMKQKHLFSLTYH